jgi:hypothetical protein
MAAFGKSDDIEIEILEDGTIKSSTNPISGANHANAEQFLKQMATLAGGTTERKRKGSGHHHHGAHTHEHNEKTHKH